MMLLTKVRLSTSNFRIRKKSIFIFKSILFIIIFTFLESVIGSLLEPPTKSYVDFDPRIRWKDFYEQENIDILFLGSSHAYRSFNPENFDTELKCNTFNLGSSSQSSIESYFALKETLRCYNPKLIVLENYWVLYEKRKTFDPATYVYDYLEFSPVKIDMLINAFTPEEYLQAQFLSVRYHNNFKELKIIKENVNNKLLDRKQLKIKRSKKGEAYTIKGYVSNENIATNKELTEENYFKNLQPSEWNEKTFLYLNKIIMLCRENNIPILLVTAPLPPTTMQMVNDYDSIHNKFRDIANQYEITYVDYNLINKDLRLLTDKHFKDDHHLNTGGANVMNKHLLNIIRPIFDECNR